MPAAIRPARIEDLDALVALEDAVFEGDRLSRRSFRRLIARHSAALFVTGEGDSIEGYSLVLFRNRNRVARLYSIATKPSSMRSGLAPSLLEAAQDAALKHGCTSLRLEVREDNARAIRLYERNGYRRIGSRKGYYQDGAAALRYEKMLTACMPARTNSAVGRRAGS
jgi:ribosomal protein S18 acetylase RimI-like enzyme